LITRRSLAVVLALAPVAVAACGGTTGDGGQVSGIINELENIKHVKPSKVCKAEGHGESCVLSWPNGEKDRIISSGPEGHVNIVVLNRR
jgi:hypothetical protein